MAAADRSLQAAGSCPCGSGQGYGACCGPLHDGAPAPTAERLMRSRYSAYALGLRDYLLASWDPATRPDALGVDPPGLKWLGLKVIAARALDDAAAEVEFVARYKVGGASAVRLHERSTFHRSGGHWYYVDGEFP